MPKKARISFGRSMPKIDEKNTKSVKMFIFVICMYEICFYSCLLSYYMLINVDYTITYFLPIPSTVPRTRARSELLNVSLVPPRVEFYTALPVSIVGRY